MAMLVITRGYRISGSIPFLVPHNELPTIGKVGWGIPQGTKVPELISHFCYGQRSSTEVHMAIWPYPCDRHYDLIGFSKTWTGMVQKLYFCIFRWDEHPQLPTVLVSKKQNSMGFQFQYPQFVRKSQHSRPGKNRPAISWCSSRLEVSSWLPVWSLSLGRDMKSWTEGTKW